MCTEWAPRYVGSSDPRLPGISPVYGDMSGLPPIVMQTAGDDPICVDADKIETACAASKTSIEHRRFAGMWHDFHLQVSLLPKPATRSPTSGQGCAATSTNRRDNHGE